jgi:hypothetical protein
LVVSFEDRRQMIVEAADILTVLAKGKAGNG